MLTHRVTKLVDYDLTPAIDCHIKGVKYRFAVCSPVKQESIQPFLYTVRRPLFDAYLVRKAVSNGTTLITQCNVISVQIDASETHVLTSRGWFSGRIVVGADGANSTIRRVGKFGVLRRRSIGCTVEIYYNSRADCEKLMEPDLLDLELGYKTSTVGYAVPKGKSITVGVFTHTHMNLLAIRSYLHRHLGTLGIQDRIKMGQAHLGKEFSCAIPYSSGISLVSSRSLLVGDAAGLADPLFGEGIYYSMKSAQLAALSILHALDVGRFDFHDFFNTIKKQILREFKLLCLADYMFAVFLRVIYQLNERTELGFLAGVSFARGEATAIDLFRLAPRCCFDWIKTYISRFY